MIHKEFPEASLLVNFLICEHSGSSKEPLEVLWNSNSTPNVADFCALSSDIFGFSLTTFPILPYYDLLTKLS